MSQLDFDDADYGLRVVEVGAGQVGERIDKVLADRVAELSRGRIQALIAQGLISFDDQPLKDGSAKAKAGLYRILIPPAAPAAPVAENIPLAVLFEDEHLIVIDKPAGMAAHPAPGSETGTLVNALLQHCGASLSGIGGVARPGIVHRLDKDTSGVMVAAKTDAAHHGLQKLFEAHDIERAYVALTRGAHPSCLDSASSEPAPTGRGSSSHDSGGQRCAPCRTRTMTTSSSSTRYTSMYGVRATTSSRVPVNAPSRPR